MPQRRSKRRVSAQSKAGTQKTRITSAMGEDMGLLPSGFESILDDTQDPKKGHDPPTRSLARWSA